MQWTNEEKQEWLDYVFQHNYNRVEQTAKRLGKKGGQFSLDISSHKREVPRSEHAVPDQGATMEFGLAISRFALPESWYNIDRWLMFLGTLAGEKHISEFDRLERRLQQIREGGMALKLNRENITDSKAYEILARGVVFAADSAASAYNQWLLKQGQIIYYALWEKYNSYCVGLWDFMQEIQEYRKKQGIRPAPVERKTICIYCKRTEGKFDHVEHIIPESLGNEYVFLPRGFVSSDCMDELNTLQDGINEMSPFSMVLVNTSTGNKKGKLPSLKHLNFTSRKRVPTS